MFLTTFDQGWQQLYRPTSQSVILVEVPRMPFLMLDGQGPKLPGTEFSQAWETLLQFGYRLRDAFKAQRDSYRHYAMPPLEALCWNRGNREIFDLQSAGQRVWTLMLMQPAGIDRELFEREVVAARAAGMDAMVEKIRYDWFEEGLAAQSLHLGPMYQGGKTMDLIADFVRGHGYRLTGQHHEIYLGDPLQEGTPQSRTIIRHPVASA